MLWIFLVEALAFAILIPVLIRAKKRRASPDEVELEKVALGEGPDGEEIRNLLSRLSNFILNWDGELERMDKRATALLIEQKARVKEGRDLELRLDGEIHHMKGEQRQREEHSQKEVAKSILGMVVRDKSPEELLDWAHPAGGAYGRAEKSADPPAPSVRPDVAAASRRSRAEERTPPERPKSSTPTEPSSQGGSVRGSRRGAEGIRSWKPEKVFAQ